MKFANKNGISLSCQRTRKSRNHFSNLPAISVFDFTCCSSRDDPYLSPSKSPRVANSCDLETTKNKQTKQQGEEDRRSFPKPKKILWSPLSIRNEKGEELQNEKTKNQISSEFVSFLTFVHRQPWVSNAWPSDSTQWGKIRHHHHACIPRETWFSVTWPSTAMESSTLTV